MSKERFDWLKTVAGEIIATPGCESNVKEIFDKTWELKTTRKDVVIFNQFEEMGNCVWHYQVTGQAIEEAFETVRREGDRFAGAAFTSRQRGHHVRGRLPQGKVPDLKTRRRRSTAVPDAAQQRFRRPPH
jgi:hypothetical protein